MKSWQSSRIHLHWIMVVEYHLLLFPDQSLQNSFYKCRALPKMLSSLVLARLQYYSPRLKQQKLSVFLSISASSWHQDQPGKLNVSWHGFWESWICLEYPSYAKQKLLSSGMSTNSENGTQVQTGLRNTSRRLNAEQASPYFIKFFCSWRCRSLYCLKERFVILVQYSLQN